MPQPFNEFDLIAKYFRPLTKSGTGAFALGDDVAMLQDADIVTKDVLVAGVHFFPDDPLDLVAKKALRVNISDIIAKAARPAGYLLGCVWNNDATEDDIALFTKGLSQDQQAHQLYLLGGDTTKSQNSGSGLTMVSVTMFGQLPKGQPLIARRNACPGDVVFVSGTIGDAYLGLLLRQNLISRTTMSKSDQAFLAGRYFLPEPPLPLISALGANAHASIDVSDGLLADAGHIAKASQIDMDIWLDKMPLSEAAGRWLANQKNIDQAMGQLATGGDDYQVLCTVAPNKVDDYQAQAKQAGVSVTKIGICLAGDGTIHALNAQRQEVEIPSSGYLHFNAPQAE